MENLQNRHDLSDAQWEKIKPVIRTRLGNRGSSNANDDRIFVNACLWIVRTGAPWRDLPPQYGKYNAVNRRCKRWCDRRHWDFVLAELIDEPDDEFLYKYRHLAENAFLKLKRRRGVATRYAKTLSSFVGAVNLAAIVLWLRSLV